MTVHALRPDARCGIHGDPTGLTGRCPSCDSEYADVAVGAALALAAGDRPRARRLLTHGQTQTSAARLAVGTVRVLTADFGWPLDRALSVVEAAL